MTKSNAAARKKNDWRADRNEELSELLRSKILDAARACLMKTDYAKLRMDMVAKEAGCSRGTLYRYFTNKEEILLTIAIVNYQRIAEEVTKGISKISDPRLQFATGLARAMELSLNGDRLNSLSMEMINRVITTDPAALQLAIATSFSPYMDSAREQGLLRPKTDLNEASLWIIQSSNGLLNTDWPNVGGTRLNSKQQVDYLCRYLLFPIFNMDGIV